MVKTLLAFLLFIMVALPALAASTANTSDTREISISSFANFSTAASSPATIGKVLIVDNPVTVNNKTISGRSIKVVEGASITVATGKVLTLHGTFEAGKYQVFSANSTVSGLNGTIKAEWWPATAEGMQSALHACGPMSELLISRQYNIGSMLTVSINNCTIRMVNGSKFISQFVPAIKLNPLVYITGSNVKLIDFHIDGNNHQHRGITIGGGNNFSMSGGKVENLGANGIAIGEDSSGSTEIASTHHVIDNVTVSNVLNNIPAIETSRGGIYVTSTPKNRIKDTTIMNCYIANNGERGIDFGGDGGSIRNNFLVSNSTSGIYVAGGGSANLGRVTVESNRIISGSGATNLGIKISTGVNDVKVTNNYIDMTASPAGGSNFGIYLQGVSNAVLLGNSVYGGAIEAIRVEPHPDPMGSNSIDVIIRDNLFNSNAAACAGSRSTAKGGYTASRIYWAGNTFKGSYTIGFSGDTEYSEYRNNKFIGSGKAENMISVAGSQITIADNYFDGFTKSAIRYEMGSDRKDYVGTVISNNIIKEVSSPAPGYGRIQLVSPSGFTHKIRDTLISGNSIDGGSYGILTTSEHSSADNNINTTISNNRIARTIRDGMLIRGSHSIITGNTIYNVSQSSSNYSGIQINGDANTVIGNILENSGTYFRHLNVSGGANNRIENNSLDTGSINDRGKATQIRGNQPL